MKPHFSIVIEAPARNLDAFQGSEDILNHHLRVDASRVVEVDGDAIPTGKLIDVAGTPWDFRTPQKIDYRWNERVGLCGGGALTQSRLVYYRY